MLVRDNDSEHLRSSAYEGNRLVIVRIREIAACSNRGNFGVFMSSGVYKDRGEAIKDSENEEHILRSMTAVSSEHYPNSLCDLLKSKSRSDSSGRALSVFNGA